MGKVQINSHAMIGLDSAILAEMIEGSANPGVGMVEGENGDLGPGIPASLAQHLQEHGVHCRVLEQDGKVVTSDHKYCGGDDGCDVEGWFLRR